MTWTFQGTVRNPYDPATPGFPSQPLDVALPSNSYTFRGMYYPGEAIKLRMYGAAFSNQVRGPSPANSIPETSNPAAVGRTTVYDFSRGGVEISPEPTPSAGEGVRDWTYDGPALAPGSYFFRNRLAGDRSTADPILAASRRFWKDDQGGTFLGVVRQHPGRSRPPLGTGVGGEAPDDAAFYHWAGFGPVRQHLPLPTTDPATYNHGPSDGLQYLHDTYFRNVDPARVKRTFGLFTDSQVVSQAYFDGIKAWVTRRAALDVVGGKNEPGGAIAVDRGYVPIQRQLYQAAKAARPGILVGGPDVENHALYTGALGRLDDYYAGGGGQYADVVTTHAYPAHGMGDSIRDEIIGYRRWNAMLAKYGQHTKPKMNTEAGTTEAVISGVFHPLQQASSIITSLLGWEQAGLGIPGSSDGSKEAWDYFYTLEHGTWGTAPTSMIIAAGVFPAGVLLYNHGYELHGCPNDGTDNVAREIDFGSRMPYMAGHVFRRRADGSGVAVFKSSGPSVEDVRIRLKGSAIPDQVVHVTGWGEERSLNVETIGTDRFVTLSAERIPQHYLRLTDGMTDDFDVVEPSWRPRRLTPVGVSFNGPSVNGQSVALVTNGSYRNSVKDNAENAAGVNEAMFAAESTLAPGANDCFEINLGALCRVDHVEISSPDMFNGDSTLLKARIEFEVAPGIWEQHGQVDELARAIPLDHVTQGGDGASRETLIWDHPLWQIVTIDPGVVAKRLRVIWEQTTVGNAFSVDSINGHGAWDPTATPPVNWYADAPGGRWLGSPAAYQQQTQRVFARAINVYGETRRGKRAIFRRISSPGRS